MPLQYLYSHLARREAYGMAEYDRSVSILHEAVHEALVKSSHDD